MNSTSVNLYINMYWRWWRVEFHRIVNYTIQKNEICNKKCNSCNSCKSEITRIARITRIAVIAVNNYLISRALIRTLLVLCRRSYWLRIILKRSYFCSVYFIKGIFQFYIASIYLLTSNQYLKAVLLVRLYLLNYSKISAKFN